MKIEISEKPGELSFGIMWISIDGRLQSEWYQTYKLALKQYRHLKGLRRHPSLNIRMENDDLNREDSVHENSVQNKGCGKYETRGAYTFTCGKSSKAGNIQYCKECKKPEQDAPNSPLTNPVPRKSDAVSRIDGDTQEYCCDKMEDLQDDLSHVEMQINIHGNNSEKNYERKNRFLKKIKEHKCSLSEQDAPILSSEGIKSESHIKSTEDEIKKDYD